MAAPPTSTKTSLQQRLSARDAQRWPQLDGVDVRFRGAFAYVTARLPDGDTMPLMRLRYGGSAARWGFAVYLASKNGYQDSVLPDRPHGRRTRRRSRHRLRPLPRRPNRLDLTPDELTSATTKSTVGRIWKAFGLKPHQVDTFKISNDPQFIDKVRDVVGLYLDPPEKALVLCVDEKSQIQALDRSAPVLPMMPGMPERRTHDYVRHGITTLFAALNVATGEVTGSIHRRHRAAEFKKFLTKLDNDIPADLDVHLICDNYATHKSPTITGWLDRHPRFHLHFTPTYSSWLNQVERWFGLLTDKRLRRGTHTSVPALEKDIRDWITTWNENPKPFAWTKTADEILERLATYLQRIPGAGH